MKFVLVLLLLLISSPLWGQSRTTPAITLPDQMKVGLGLGLRQDLHFQIQKSRGFVGGFVGWDFTPHVQGRVQLRSALGASPEMTYSVWYTW